MSPHTIDRLDDALRLVSAAVWIVAGVVVAYVHVESLWIIRAMSAGKS